MQYYMVCSGIQEDRFYSFRMTSVATRARMGLQRGGNKIYRVMTIYIIIVTSRSAVKRLSALETSEHQQARGLEKIRRIDGAKVGKHSAEWRVKRSGKNSNRHVEPRSIHERNRGGDRGRIDDHLAMSVESKHEYKSQASERPCCSITSKVVGRPEISLLLCCLDLAGQTLKDIQHRLCRSHEIMTLAR